MKRVLTLLIMFVCGVHVASAQDVIVKKSGTTVSAIVDVVGPDTIKYRLYEDPDGVRYEVLKDEIAAIHYKSGRVENFNANVSSYDALLYGKSPVAEGIVPGMKYRELKKIYNYKEYVPGLVQSHNPAWCGVASWIIPGLGQMVSGSVGRGFAFLGGYVGCSALTYMGALAGLGGEDGIGQVLILASCLGMLAVDICSIVDAVRVAKVTNMYENDLRKKYSLNVEMYPSVGYVRDASGFQPAPGLTLALKF